MDNTTIDAMKEDAIAVYEKMRTKAQRMEGFRLAQAEDEAMRTMLQAIQAYAAIAQVEAMERMDSPQVTVGKSLHTHLFVPDDTLNRGDQSIADAISEQVTDPPDTNWASDYICIQGHQHGSASFRLQCDEKVAE